MKPLRVYFAGAFARRTLLQDLAKDLCADGSIQSTARWLRAADDLPDDDRLSENERTTWALRNLADIGSSDVLVTLAEPPSSPYRRGGRHAEVGAALALLRPVFLWGTPEHVFHHHVLVSTFATREELLAAVRSFARQRLLPRLAARLPAAPAGGQLRPAHLGSPPP